MKRLIAISVVFALAAGAAFAVDLSGDVIGTVNFLEGTSAKNANDDPLPLGASGSFKRFRLEGSGENDEGTYGGWIRGGFNADKGGLDFEGYAWWKPLDLLKITIGGNSDGMYGKEGVTGWMFYQRTSDTGVVNPNHVWYTPNSYYSGGGFDFGFKTRDAFYGGFDANALHLTISPVEMVDINIALPFFSADPSYKDGAASHVFQRINAQLDFKFDFGNIALTYAGGLGFSPATAASGGTDYYFTESSGKLEWTSTKPGNDDDILDTKTVGGKAAVKEVQDPGRIFAYFGLTSIENLGVDVGIGFPLPLKDDSVKGQTTTHSAPLAAGLGVKFTAGDFGIKTRIVASFAGSKKEESNADKDPLKTPFKLIADILPFYGVSDTLRIYFSAGLGLTGATEKNDDWQVAEKDAIVGWHVNPYVEVGQDWGPKFIAGIKLWSNGLKNADDETTTNWAIPLALHVSF